MYNKKSLADKFNRKKTIQNDLNRLQNIHQQIKHKLHIATLQPFPSSSNFISPDNNSIYKFNNNISTNIDYDIPRENLYDKIPKISFKELPIPSYSQTDKFDLNTIRQNIPTPINMDIFTSDITKNNIIPDRNEANIKRLKKKGIYKIFHVYQEKYADNLFPTGFGDFIRSCFFIYQFCSKYGFQCEIIINHPIAQFLNNFHNSYLPNSSSSLTLNDNVFMFSDTNWAESVFDNKNYIEKFLLVKQKFYLFIDYLCSLPIVNGNVFSYNILFPYDYISLEECNKIRSLFEPSREIIEKVNYHLSNLSLIENQFIVLHIRSGDSYLKNQNKLFYSPYFEIIKNEIIEIIFKEKNNDILLIADTNEIKLLLNDEFPNIKFLVYNITHLGEGVGLENEKVKNTMIDFYLMSKSSAIYSLTSYPHGSGFSYWCAKIYGIPYKCKYITPL